MRLPPLTTFGLSEFLATFIRRAHLLLHTRCLRAFTGSSTKLWSLIKGARSTLVRQKKLELTLKARGFCQSLVKLLRTILPVVLIHMSENTNLSWLVQAWFHELQMISWQILTSRAFLHFLIKK